MLSTDNVVIAPYQMEITIGDDSTKDSLFPLCIVTVVLFFSNLRKLKLTMNQRKHFVLNKNGVLQILCIEVVILLSCKERVLIYDK